MMLSLLCATVGYRGRMLLKDVGLALTPGEVVGLIAPNGFGKTTLMRVLAGDVGSLRSGWLKLDGTPPDNVRKYARGVYMSQADSGFLYRNMSCRYHLDVVRTLWRSEKDPGEVARLAHIEEFVGMPARKLSQGMGRQLALAMALESNARYVLLDEPFNALDPTRTDAAGDIIRHMAASGAGVLVSSHNPEAMDRLCDHYLFIRDNRLVQVGRGRSCRELFHEFYG